jgi:hypothetical protein
MKTEWKIQPNNIHYLNAAGETMFEGEKKTKVLCSATSLPRKQEQDYQ